MLASYTLKTLYWPFRHPIFSALSSYRVYNTGHANNSWLRMFNEAIAAGSPSQRVASIGKVVDAWAAAHQRVKALRSCRSRLESDLEALACGARTVVMLDYTPGLTSKGLKWAVEHLSSWWPCE